MARYSKQYAQQEAADRKRAKQVKAHKRRINGQIVHVKGYCRKPPRTQRQVKREMPF